MIYISDRGAYLEYLYRDCHCVNAHQSNEERRIKYMIVRGYGLSRSHASKLRDYRPNNVAKFLGFRNWNELIEDMEKRIGD